MVKRFSRNQKLMNDDPLDFIMSMLGNRHRKYLHVMQVFIFIVVSYLQFFNFICIMDIILYKNFAYLEYLPVIFLQQTGCFGLVMVSMYSKDVFRFQEMVFSKFWSISSGGAKTKNRILRESKIIKFICILNYGLSVLTHLSFIPIVGDEKRLVFPVMYCAKHFGGWSKLLIFVFYLCLVLISYGVAYTLFLATYIIFHVRFQFYLLNVDVCKLPKEEPFLFLFNNQQRRRSTIYGRISVCAKRHADIKMVTKILARKLQNVPMLIICLCGILTFVSTSYLLIFQISPPSNWRMVLVLMTIISISVTFCILGQKMTDESNKFFIALCNTPWYHWNTRCKMALGMILTNSLEPLKVSCYGLVDLNYSFILLAVRVIYSLLAISRKFK